MDAEADLKPQVIQRIVKNFGAGAVGQVLNIVIQFISVPLFLQYWGVQRYGEWLVLSSALAYLALADLSVAEVAGNEMAMQVGKGDRERAFESFQNSWVLITSLSLALTTVFLLAMWLLPLEGILQMTAFSHSETALVFTLLVGQALFTLQWRLAGSVYRSEGYLGRYLMASNSAAFAEFLATLCCLTAGFQAIELATAYLCIRALGLFVLFRDLRRKAPWAQIGFRRVERGRVQKLASMGIVYMGIPFAMAMTNQGLLLLIGIFLGPLAVVAFGTVRTLSRIAFQPIGQMKNSVWPEISLAFGAGDLNLVRTLHRRACQLSWWLSAAMLLSLYFIGEALFHMWTRGNVPFDQGLFDSLLAVILVNSMWNVSWVVSLATNLFNRSVSVYLASSVGSLLLAAFCIPTCGLRGAAASLLVGEIVMLVVVLRSSLSLVEDHFIPFARSFFAPIYISRLWLR